MTIFPARKPRDPRHTGCAVCGFQKGAAIHQIPQKSAKAKASSGHAFQSKHADGEPEYQSWLAALANKEQPNDR